MRAVAITLALVFAAGCASSQITKARQSVVLGVHVFTTGADALEAARQAEEDSLIAKVQAGQLTPDQAEAQYRAWMTKGQKAMTALIVLWDSIKTAAHIIDAADAKLQADLPGVLANVLAALSSAVAALADVGIHIPGVK